MDRAWSTDIREKHHGVLTVDRKMEHCGDGENCSWVFFQNLRFYRQNNWSINCEYNTVVLISSNVNSSFIGTFYYFWYDLLSHWFSSPRLSSETQGSKISRAERRRMRQWSEPGADLRDTSGLLMWGCMRFFSLVNVLPADDCQLSSCVEKQCEALAGSRAFYFRGIFVFRLSVYYVFNIFGALSCNQSSLFPLALHSACA